MSSTTASSHGLRPTAGPDGVAPGRYTSVAKALHWTIAALILAQLIGGIVMHELPNTAPFKIEAYQLHKSFGLTVLALSVFRLGWRLTHRPPPLPEHTSGWERLLARFTHVAFYALIIAVPLAGWLMVSASPFPSSFFFLFPIPDLPGAGVLSRDAWAEVHELMAFAIIGLLVLHVAGALKHRYVDHDGVLARMLPGSRSQTGNAT